jgi:hypothetical protein
MCPVEVSQRIAARPQRVWSLIGDPTTMGGITEECTAMEWAPGSTGPAVGARFRGHNRHGRRRWTTTCTIVRYQPGSEVSWDVTFGPLAVARWVYRLEPVGSGDATVVHERYQDHRGVVVRTVGPLLRGTRDADGFNRAHMESTLLALKDRAET